MTQLNRQSSKRLYDQFAADFVELGRRNITIEVNAMDLWLMCVAVQVACRHPGFKGPSRIKAEGLANRLIRNTSFFSPVLQEVYRRGKEPDYNEEWDATNNKPQTE